MSMPKRKQRQLLRSITRHMTQHLLAQSARWPAEWDGHELRELVADAFNNERTRLMRESRQRRKACHNAILVERLY